MTRHRLLLAAAAFLACGTAGVQAADAPPDAKDTLILTDGRIVDCPKAEKQADGSYKLSYAHGDVVLPAAYVRLAFTQRGGAYEPKNDEEKAKLEKGLVPYEGNWIPKAERDAKAAKKAADTKKRVEDAKKHRNWRDRYKVPTANYQFEYTISPEIAKGYMDLMETYYSVFTKDFHVSRPPKEKLKVCFYHDYETFLEVSGAPRGVIGYYMPVGKRELNFFYDRLRPELTTAVMFHESQHYLSHLFNLQFRIPHNFSEAFAEYYGGSAWDPAKKTMEVGGVQEGRLTEIQTDIAAGEKKPLANFLRNQLEYDDYTWGWSFVHFMMQTPRYASKFRKFYVALPTAKDVARTTNRWGQQTVEGEALYGAFKKYMAIDDIRTLQDEWYQYIDTSLKTTSVVGFEYASMSALRTGRFIRAKRLFKEAIDKGSKSPSIHLEYGNLLDGDEAIAMYRKGLEFDPLYPSLYVALGREMRALKTDEAKKEGTRLIQLAADLDPDDERIWMEVEDALERDAPPPALPGKEGEGNGGNDSGGSDGGDK